MYLAYRPAKGSGLGGAAIDALSGFGGVCHVELVFANGDTLRASYGEPVSLGPGRDRRGWIIEPIADVTPLEEAIVRTWAQREVGSPYDTWGVLRFVLPFVGQHPDAWFCSEICVAALQRINLCLGVRPWEVSPNRLRKLDKRPQYFLSLPAA